jgi:hypothetical protein
MLLGVAYGCEECGEGGGKFVEGFLGYEVSAG